MNLKQEFLVALAAGQEYDALLELVRRHEARGLAPREVYNTLQKIWLEFGFDNEVNGSSMQNELEAVMEKIWYECPA
jgi:hypothetical protein